MNEGMTKDQRAEFRGFCKQATDTQLRNIIADEKARARGGESEYYQMCYEIAQAEAERRGINE